MVVIKSGDKVPADLRLLRATNLQVQEAMLTGESVPVSKTTAPAAREAGLVSEGRERERVCVGSKRHTKREKREKRERHDGHDVTTCVCRSAHKPA